LTEKILQFILLEEHIFQAMILQIIAHIFKFCQFQS